MDNRGKVNTMSPLTWAYIGDAVYELYIRNHLVETTNYFYYKKTSLSTVLYSCITRF